MSRGLVVEGPHSASVTHSKARFWVQAAVSSERLNFSVGASLGHGSGITYVARIRSDITYEADPKHVRIMLEEWSMTSCNKVATRGGDR